MASSGMTITICGSSYIQVASAASLQPGNWINATFSGRVRSMTGLRIESIAGDRLELEGNPQALGWAPGDELLYWFRPHAEYSMKPESTVKPDPINPPHYKAGGLEAADVCDAWELNHNLASAVEYILRADRKGDALTDLKKAVWRLQREIARRER